MLLELKIQDFAIIDKAHLSLGRGLTVLTGETGAGKSILIDALEVLLGSKASSHHIRTGCEESYIEALFALDEGDDVLDLLKNSEIPCEENEVLIRRILSRSGKGRIYINDQWVTIRTLQRIGGLLVDLHGQHDQQSLLQIKNHMTYLDSFEGSIPERPPYKMAFLHFKETEAQMEELNERTKTLSKQKQDIEEMIQAIEQTQPQPNEDDNLSREREILKHSQQLSQWAEEAHFLLASDNSVISQTQKALFNIQNIQKIDPEFKGTVELTEAALAQLEEVWQQVRHYQEKMEYDPQRLDQIEERLFQLQGFKRRFGGSIDEILQKGQEKRKELSSLEGLDQEADLLKGRYEDQLKTLIKRAKELSAARTQQARVLERYMKKELASLKMEKCHFKVDLKTPSEIAIQNLTPSGVDYVEFLISSNAGEDLKPLNQVASGGELSRIMLALRKPKVERGGARTLIFDEVDAGLGGAVAEVVGEKLKKLSQTFQVLCITHLPQIASQAETHYAVSKEEGQKKTKSMANRLSKEQRVKEIARMLGGQKITPKTLEHAKEMLGNTIQPGCSSPP